MTSKSESGALGAAVKKLARGTDPEVLRNRAETATGRLAWLKRAGWGQLSALSFAVRRMFDEDITRPAAALTYRTLLAIVPVLAVAFALFQAFGGLAALQEPLQQLIVENLAVARRDEVSRFLDRTIGNISAGAIAGPAVILLFYSAVSMLLEVERSFNHIWGSRAERPLYVRFAIYWCVLTLAPPLIALSISISARLQVSTFAATVERWLPLDLGRWLLQGASLVAISLAIALCFVVIPTARVPPRAALVGGLVTGLLWSAAKVLFITLTAGSAKTSAIYGTLSALPLLMLWLYTSWSIALFGLMYTQAYQAYLEGRLAQRAAELSPSLRARMAARILLDVSARFRGSGGASTIEHLAAGLGAPPGCVAKVAHQLEREGLIAPAGNVDDAYLPGRDPRRLTVWQSRCAVLETPADAFALPDTSEATRELDALDEALRRGERDLLDVNFHGILSRHAHVIEGDEAAGTPGEASYAEARRETQGKPAAG